MAYKQITCSSDELLTVFIDRVNPAAGVFYKYDEYDEQPTAFQTADMPLDDEQAAEKVSTWIGQ